MKFWPPSIEKVTSVLEEAGETVWQIGLLTRDGRPGVHYIGSLG